MTAPADPAGAVILQLPLDPADAPLVLDNDEYGNPRTGQPALRYSWLGGKQRSTETLTGLTLMGVRLYNPVIGRFLSLDPVYGGNANAYEYVHADPINTYDLDGRWSVKSWWNKKKKDWGRNWKHKLVNVGVGVAAATFTAACIASVVCGGGLFLVGSAAVFAGGLAGHYAVSTRAQRRRGVGRWLLPTAKAQVKGTVCGALWGRGCGGGFLRGSNPKWAAKASRWGGSPPLLHGVRRSQWGRTVGRYLRRLW